MYALSANINDYIIIAVDRVRSKTPLRVNITEPIVYMCDRYGIFSLLSVFAIRSTGQNQIRK